MGNGKELPKKRKDDEKMCDCIERLKEKIAAEFNKPTHINAETFIEFRIFTRVKRKKRYAHPVEYEEGWSKKSQYRSYGYKFCPICGGPWKKAGDV
ncbi:MAG: hypothetical protein WC364_10550 [Eubacteriales bacterium]